MCKRVEQVFFSECQKIIAKREQSQKIKFKNIEKIKDRFRNSEK